MASVVVSPWVSAAKESSYFWSVLFVFLVKCETNFLPISFMGEANPFQTSEYNSFSK